MKHVVVTRFSVPRPQDPERSNCHLDPIWLDHRLLLFRRFFAPSVGRLGVPVILLCSSASAAHIADATGDLDWSEVVEQDEWHGGWSGDSDRVVTRMDTDDAVHEGWLAAVEAAPVGTEVCCTREFLRFDLSTGKLSAYSRQEPSPLAAFFGGRNPFARDHARLDHHYRVHNIAGSYLLQAFHGGNISTRRPSWYRRRLPLERLEPFGVSGCVSTSKGRAV